MLLWGIETGRTWGSCVSLIGRFLDRRRIWKALPTYPVYAPPVTYGRFWKKPPSRKQIEQNFEYFLQHKSNRLKYLAEYLTSFSIELRLEADALPQLGSWLYRYIGHLDPGGGDVVFALSCHEPELR